MGLSDGQVTYANTQRMKNCGHRSHNPSEDLRGRGQTEAQRFELVSAAKSHKAQEATRFRMNRNLKIRLLKVDGGHPIPLSDRQKNRLDGLHAEVRNVHEAIEERQVDNRSPRPRGLPNHKQAAVKAGRRKKNKFHSTLGNQSQGDLLERSPFDGSRGTRRHGNGFRRQRRRPEEGYAIPLPEDLHHPWIHALVPPGLPVEGQTAARQG